jgi:hypothetical protein
LDPTILKVFIGEQLRILNSQGESLTIREDQRNFPGFMFLKPGTQRVINKTLAVTEIAIAGSLFSSIGLLTFTSFFSQILACLSKLIQIVEFTSLLEYYNFFYDPYLESFLSDLNKITSFNLLNIPQGKYKHRLENTEATQSKGKLSKTKLPPYLIQDLGYPGIITMVL